MAGLASRTRDRWLAAALLLGASCADESAAPPRRPYNVLLVCVDDLRPALGCLGDPLAVTPSIDALAAAGVVFGRAYCQIPLCSPSRLSILSGRRPETLGVYDQVATLRDAAPDAVTLPQHFRANGYVTCSVGKNFHGGHDDPASWTVPNRWQQGLAAATGEEDDEADLAPASGAPAARFSPKRDTSVWRAVDGDAVRDRGTCDAALAALRELSDERFFLAVGFARPHIPWVVPREAFEAHPPKKFSLPRVYEPPSGVAAVALHGFSELRRFADVPDTGPVPDEKALELIRAYYACVTYIDSLIGELVAELDELGLRENTLVVLWSDHGVHLGEQGMWTKQTLFEASLRVPLVFALPGSTPEPARGRTCDALVETVDLFPTLVDLCGLPAPEGLDGVSLRPLIEDPTRPWKRAAFSVLYRYAPEFGMVRGEAVTDGRTRYVEWTRGGEPFAQEFYDLEGPAPESENLARRGGGGRLIDARRLLSAGWRAAAPGERPRERPGEPATRRARDSVSPRLGEPATR